MQNIRNRYKKQTSTKRGRIIFFSLLFLILGGIAGGLIYWSIYKKQIIRDTLESTIRNKSSGLYNITYGELKLDEVAGNLSVSNFNLVYDSVKFENLAEAEKAPPSLLRIKIPQILVSGVKTPRALIDNELVGAKLQILNPVIEIIYTNTGKDSARSVPTKEVYEQILGNLDLIKIDTVEITGAIISTHNMRTGSTNIQLMGTNIRLLDVAVDSLANLDSTRLLFSRQVDLSCSQVRWGSADKLYKYGVDSVRISSEDNLVQIGAFFIHRS